MSVVERVEQATGPRPFLTRQEKDMAAYIAERLADQIMQPLTEQIGTLHGTLAGALEGVQAAPQDVSHGWQSLAYVQGVAAGQPALYTVSAASLWPLSVFARLTCSGAVADRRIVLEYQDGDGNRFVVAGADVIVQASDVQAFCWQPAVGPGAGPAGDVVLLGLPQQLLRYQQRLAVRVVNMDTADQLDQVRISGLFSAAADEA